MKLKSTLLLGGARSGKSHFAQALAFKSDQPVLFVATAEPGDEEMRQRIEEHQKVRPSTWQ
ncbi:MAG: bifunctional adenosylcobinamide kinase/adenosylcobinamide-phosphate guanylyltransferase, partial [Dehalococcoidales bacterium]|nr:bifunctional adenosylcobinamide kinase/adenosylcobinamide-phosphate guanylyltransferase [Dehalococcoidales bacterium]